MTHASDVGATLEHQIGPRGRLVIRQGSVDITIRGVGGDRVKIESEDADDLGQSFSVETGEGFVELRQIEKLGFGIFGRGESAELDIEVPHGATVSIEAQSADIHASDLSGHKSFRTASGELTLERMAGPVEIETVSGDVAIEG